MSFFFFCFLLWLVTAAFFGFVGSYLAKQIGWSGFAGAVIGVVFHALGVAILALILVAKVLTEPAGIDWRKLVAPFGLLFLIFGGGFQYALHFAGHMVFHPSHALFDVAVVGAVAYVAAKYLERPNDQTPMPGVA